MFQLDPVVSLDPAPSGEPSGGQAAEAPAPEDLWGRLAALDRRIAGYLDPEGSQDIVARVFSQECPRPDPEALRRQRLLNEAERRDEDPGFSLRGAYTYRERESTALNFDDDQDAYVELSWDLLRQGYHQRRGEAEILRHEAALLAMEGRENRRAREALCLRHRLPVLFAPMRDALLAGKLEIVAPLHEATRAAYLRGERHLDDVLDLESERREAWRGRDAVARLGGAAARAGLHPPPIELDLEALVARVESEGSPAHALWLRQQVVRERNRLDELDRLRLFVRAEMNDLGEGGATDMVAGLRFSVPLDMPRDRSLELELQELAAVDRIEAWERRLDLEEAYGAFVEQRTRGERATYGVLRARERVRRSLATWRLYPEDADLAQALRRGLDLVDAALALVDARQETYRRASTVLAQAGVGYAPEVVLVGARADPGYRSRTGTRALYAWSRSFNRLDNGVISEFMRAKGVSRLLVSAGSRTSGRKLEGFLDRAARDDLHVELVLAENTWVHPRNHDRAAAAVAAAAALHPAVHLDVEPQVFDDFKARQDHYLEDFTALLDRARAALPAGASLTVAVPVWWPQGAYRDIAARVDGLYLMAYGSARPERIAERIRPILDVADGVSVVVVLRVEDFRDEWHLEQVIDAVAAATGQRRFALHKLGSFLQMAEGLR